MRRSRQIALVLLVLVASGATGAWIYYQQHHFKHFAVHDPGMVYRSAWLSADALSQLIETYQIRSVVNLCNPDEMTPQMWASERRAVASAGATLHAVPLPNSIEFDPHVWEQHLEILANPNNYPMLVHCQHGVTRTAMFLATYDVIHRHQTAEESLSAQPLFGHTKDNVHLQAFGKNLQKFADENRDKFAAHTLESLR
jgi:rhodanese/phosphatase family protein